MSQEHLTENTRILVIDDTESIHTDFDNILMPVESTTNDLKSLEMTLFGESDNEVQRSFQLFHAFQGLEGVQMVNNAIATNEPFALAFVDARMPPGIDGIETILKIWDIDPEMNIVLCSAYTDYSWESIFECLGDTDKLLILKKPFDLAEVQQMAYALCKKWNLQVQARSNAQDLQLMIAQKTQDLEKQKKHLQTSLQALKETKVKLFQADRLASVGQLAAGVAHEINNPISFIQSNIQYIKYCLEQTNCLEQTSLTDSKNIHFTNLIEEGPSVIADIEDGLQRITRIVRDLLDFSRDTGEANEIIDLHSVIQKSLTIAQTQIKCFQKKKEIAIRTQFNATSTLKGHSGQLGQVVLNLVINAAQAIESKGIICVDTVNDNKYVLIRVTDNGSGISESVMNRIFDPFYTTKQVGEGTGLGLHIVQQIVNQHAGTIKIESEIKKGTRFIIRLPVLSVSSSNNSDMNHIHK